MVIIKTEGDQFWIEQHVTNHSSVVTAAIDNEEVVFDKTGIILALAVTYTTANAVSNWNQWFTRAGANGILRIGTELQGVAQTGMRSRLRNDSGSTITIDVYLTVMLKRGAG